AVGVVRHVGGVRARLRGLAQGVGGVGHDAVPRAGQVLRVDQRGQVRVGVVAVAHGPGVAARDLLFAGQQAARVVGVAVGDAAGAGIVVLVTLAGKPSSAYVQ